MRTLALALSLFFCCGPYEPGVRQFGLTETINVEGEVLLIDTVCTPSGGVVKKVIYKAKIK